MLFADRQEAGMVLATRLGQYAGRADVVVLGLARGGVPVAHEVATRLGVAFDVFTVRKLGVPGHEELAMGAIASGGVLIVNEDVVHGLGIPARALERVAEAEQRELARREGLYRGGRPPLEVRGRVVILVDDGLATGSSMRAAVAALRQKEPKRIVVAAPIGSGVTCAELHDEVDEVVCAVTPEPFYGVGSWYRDFSQTSDAEVQRLLRQGRESHGSLAAARSA
jgi:predicted phosphoribosyltransferase